jgi:hypothetical protein
LILVIGVGVIEILFFLILVRPFVLIFVVRVR